MEKEYVVRKQRPNLGDGWEAVAFVNDDEQSLGVFDCPIAADMAGDDWVFEVDDLAEFKDNEPAPSRTIEPPKP